MSWIAPEGTEWILFMISSKTCPACELLKPRWPEIAIYLQKLYGRRLWIEEILCDTKNIDTFNKDKYIVEMTRYIAWFPCVMLISRAAYQACRSKLTAVLPAAVFNGVVEPYPEDGWSYLSKVTPSDRRMMLAPDLAAWVEKSIDHLINAPFVPMPARDTSPTPITARHVVPDDTCGKMRIFPRNMVRTIHWHKS